MVAFVVVVGVVIIIIMVEINSFNGSQGSIDEPWSPDPT